MKFELNFPGKGNKLTADEEKLRLGINVGPIKVNVGAEEVVDAGRKAKDKAVDGYNKLKAKFAKKSPPPAALPEQAKSLKDKPQA